MRTAKSRTQQREIIKRIHKLIDFRGSLNDDGTWEVKTFNQQDVSVHLSDSGTITVKVTDPTVLFLNANAGPTTVIVMRADGYMPIARHRYYDEFVTVLRAIPLPSNE